MYIPLKDWAAKHKMSVRAARYRAERQTIKSFRINKYWYALEDDPVEDYRTTPYYQIRHFTHGGDKPIDFGKYM